jgi:hypothetical protein
MLQLAYFRANQVYVGQFGQFKAPLWCSSNFKTHYWNIKKIQLTFNLFVISKLFRGHHATSKLCLRIVWNGYHLDNFKSKWYWNCLIVVLLNGYYLENLKRELDWKWPNVELSCIGNFNINNDNHISKPILILQDFLKYLNICVTWRYLAIYYTTLWKSFQRMSSTGSDQIVVVWKREHFENEFIL